MQLEKMKDWREMGSSDMEKERKKGSEEEREENKGQT